MEARLNIVLIYILGVLSTDYFAITSCGQKWWRVVQGYAILESSQDTILLALSSIYIISTICIVCYGTMSRKSYRSTYVELIAAIIYIAKVTLEYVVVANYFDIMASLGEPLYIARRSVVLLALFTALKCLLMLACWFYPKVPADMLSANNTKNNCRPCPVTGVESSKAVMCSARNDNNIPGLSLIHI